MTAKISEMTSRKAICIGLKRLKYEMNLDHA